MSTAILSINPEVVWEGTTEEGVRLYDAATGDFQALNPTGSWIWCLIAKGLEMHDIVARLAETHMVPDSAADFTDETDVITREVGEFIEQLVDQGLVLAAT